MIDHRRLALLCLAAAGAMAIATPPAQASRRDQTVWNQILGGSTPAAPPTAVTVGGGTQNGAFSNRVGQMGANRHNRAVSTPGDAQPQ
ncbi:hypothetical protein GWK16_08335 [Roseomonas sp. JC162]|uniref:Uncharacterized protein n=1 Tax=Neoroseomonas marina TaxID=1232220 RepID=A0A848E9V4_9PROT|nr:hypothetical protein [Neoroseomonas marina]NMJ41244.1 hypothetical protein [Neoroseomonas marina]